MQAVGTSSVGTVTSEYVYQIMHVRTTSVMTGMRCVSMRGSFYSANKTVSYSTKAPKELGTMTSETILSTWQSTYVINRGGTFPKASMTYAKTISYSDTGTVTYNTYSFGWNTSTDYITLTKPIYEYPEIQYSVASNVRAITYYTREVYYTIGMSTNGQSFTSSSVLCPYINGNTYCQRSLKDFRYAYDFETKHSTYYADIFTCGYYDAASFIGLHVSVWDVVSEASSAGTENVYVYSYYTEPNTTKAYRKNTCTSVVVDYDWEN